MCCSFSVRTCILATFFASNILISIALTHVTGYIILASPRILTSLDTLVDNGDGGSASAELRTTAARASIYQPPQKEAGIRTVFKHTVKNDLVQVWNRDTVPASTQSWHTSTQYIHANGSEAGAAGEDNALLSD